MAAQMNGYSSGVSNGATRPDDTLPKELVDEMQAIFGKHPGYRTTHAKGLLVEGTFTPTEQARSLSIAPHFNNASTPVIARFSVGGGIPHIPDVDDSATPKGLAIRFQIDDDTHTDLIAHSFNGFATRTGEDFLAFLQLFRTFKVAQFLLEKAKAGGGDYSKELENFKKAAGAFHIFLASHPSAAAFVNAPKPNPFNYGTITYWEPNTHVLTNKDGKITNVRYRLDPEDGEHLYPNDPEQLNKLGKSYLEDDLQQRFPEKPIVFTIQAHIADPTDVLDDATIPYKSTTFVPVGRLELNKVSDDNAAKQQQIAFSPAPDQGGIKGISSSKDPLIQTRKGVYWISADQRRHEKQVE
ncbi:catalase-like domain-containing protein [Hypoxylon sp. FL0890]|nr:catalase-like domain-containing protein [Hypoxylon sp. FL0890]